VSARPGQPDAPVAGNLAGIATMVAGVFCLATMDALAKFLGEGYPVVQLVFLRSAIALPLLLAIAWVCEGGFAGLRTRRPWVHVARSGLVALAIFSFYTALTYLPLAEVTAIAFAAPLIMTALSHPLLGERVGWRRWSAVLVGFAGVLIVVKPGTAAFQPAALIALAAALFYALMLMTARKFAASESALSLVVWSTAGAGLIAGALTPFAWTPVAAGDAGWFLALGGLGAVTMLLLTRAFHLAPAAVVAPFDYTALIWALAYGWLIWGEVPAATTWAGAAVIAGAGLYVTHRESRRRG
jgi:drug/metabolite transporter (DMT)-like permease